MPCSFEFYNDLNLVKISITGTVSPRDLLSLLDALNDDARYSPTINEMIWLTCTSSSDFDDQKLRNMADLVWGMHLRSGTSKRIALVTPSEAAYLAASDFVTEFRRGGSVMLKVCEDAHSAQAFLETCDPRLDMAELQD